ncbi:MAG: DUF4011 domain-containing protein, partial [Propionibacteriaceae bacterium]|nr:DUF4011 domain-containing protein [Propionibacteriaceae bacterium]
MASGVRVDVVATPWVNHAMAHVGLPFVRRVIIDLSGLSGLPGAVREVRVEISVTDQFGDVLTRPWSRTHPDPDPADPWVLDDLDIAFEPGAISTVEEETGAELAVAVDLDGERVATTFTPLRVLAARHWILDPRAPLLSLELLAAFVQPNHPAIAALLPEVADRLAKRTGQGSLSVAGLRPAGIDSLVEAVFDAVRDREIHYAEPPASWGYGQKVRTPGDVLDGRIGTCLDTTLTLAAVLEQIGVPTVVWLARGHSFLGYWREFDRGLPNAATTEVAQAANAVDLDLMGVIETTMVTAQRRPPKDLFTRATDAVKDHWFTRAGHELQGVVDVAMARMLRIHPLPSRRLRPDGVVEVVEYAPAAREPGGFAGRVPGGGALPGSAVDEAGLDAAGRDAGRGERAAVPRRIQGWQNALLDLSLRNKLLNMNQAMTQVGLIVPQGELGTVAGMLQSGRALALRAVEDLNSAVRMSIDRDAHAIPGDVQRDLLEVRSTIFTDRNGPAHKSDLDRLRFRAQSGRRETGANPLVLSLGRLDWRLGDRELSAPLVLVSAEIRGLTQPYRLAMDTAGEVAVNRSLLEKLRHEFGFTVPALAELPETADGAVDVAEVLRLVRVALDESQLGFRVVDEARLSISGFTGYLLWRDLDEHWATFCASPLVAHLVAAGQDTATEWTDPPAALSADAVPPLDEVVAVAPIPADGSQAQAIALARAGRSFVLEGPPGTGKSQTITNILADQMMQGRRVLFVAEKGAALDVVRKRLGQVGLLPYTLDLHDRNASPTTVKAGLKAALAQQPQSDADGYRVAAQDVHAAAAVLAGYRDRLHDANPAGLSLWDAHSQQLALGDGPSLPVPETAVADAAVAAAELRRAVADAVGPLAELGPHAAAQWGFAGAAGAPADQVVAAAERVDRALAEIAEDALPSAIATVPDLAAAVWLLLEPGLGDDLADLDSPRWRDAITELRARTGALAGRAAPVLSRLEAAVLDLDLTPVRQALREAEASFFIGRKGRLLRAGAPVLEHLHPGQEILPADLPPLVESLAGLAADQQDLRRAWRSLPGLAPIAELTLVDPGSGARIDEIVARCTRAAQLYAQLPASIAADIHRLRRVGPARAESLAEPAAAWESLARLTESRPDDQARYAGEAGLLATWR